MTIAGSIEPGAILKVKGDLTVGRGVLGETTRVVVSGEMRAQFIQNAIVVIKGNLWVGSYIHNASVRCGGWLNVSSGGGSRGGSVIGGWVCATKGIELSNAGSAMTSGTVLGLQANPEQQAKLEILAVGIAFCDDNVA